MRKFSSQSMVLALVASLGVTVAGCGQVAMIQARMALKDGHTAYQQQDYRGAVEAYEKAIVADPTQTEAFFYLGNSYDNQFRPTRRGEPANDRRGLLGDDPRRAEGDVRPRLGQVTEQRM